MFRIFLSVILLGCPFLTWAHEPETFEFVNGYWFDGTGFQKRVVYVADNQFQEQAPENIDHHIDLGGRYIIPPFGDAHHHGFGTPDNLARDRTAFMTAGIFYAKNPNNLTALVTEVREHLNQPETVDVLFANGGLTSPGGHPVQIYEGPLNSEKPGQTLADNAYFTIDNLETLARKWPLILAGKPDFLKIYLEYSEDHALRKGDPAYFGKRGLDPALLPHIVAKAKQAGLTVTAHVNTAADFHNAIVAGVDEIAHLPLAEISQADAQLAAARGTTVVTTAISHRDTSHVANLAELHKQNLETLMRAGVKLAIGTDAHTTALDEVKYLQKLGLFTSRQLLKLWCEATPSHIFPNRRIGHLKPGYEASFLALKGNPLEDFHNVEKIELRLKQGHWISIETPENSLSLTDLLLPIALHRGIDAALARYQSLKTEQAGKLDFGEAQLNELGYALLNRDKVAEAIAVFRLNVAQFPRSLNPYDSLAEALQKGGFDQEAAQNYRRVLEILAHVHGLDPKIRARYEANAKKQLERLRVSR